MTKGKESPHDHILSGVLFTSPHEGAQLALRVGNWKLIKGKPGPHSLGWSGPMGSDPKYSAGTNISNFSDESILLFDLSVDEEEKHDLSEQEPETLKQFLPLLRKYDVEAPQSYVDAKTSE